LTSEVVLEKPEIRSTDRNILIDNNKMYNKLHIGMPGGSGDDGDEGDKSDKRNAIPTACRKQRAARELERFHLRMSDVDAYEGEDGDDADVNEEEEAPQADDGSIQNVED